MPVVSTTDRCTTAHGTPWISCHGAVHQKCWKSHDLTGMDTVTTAAHWASGEEKRERERGKVRTKIGWKKSLTSGGPVIPGFTVEGCDSTKSKS